MKNLSFRFKLAAAFILFVLCILAFITFLVFEVSLLRKKSELRERILGLAKISALFVDTCKLMGIKPELSSQYTQPYKDIKLSL